MPDVTPVPPREAKKRERAVVKHETWQLRQDLKTRKVEAKTEARRERNELASKDPLSKQTRALRVAGVAAGLVIVAVAVVLTVLELVGVTLDWPLVLDFLKPFIGWPLVVLALGVILRGEIASLLGRLAELKWGDKVASFLPASVQEGTRNVREEADAILKKADEAEGQESSEPTDETGPQDNTTSKGPQWHHGLALGFDTLFDEAEYDPTGSVVRAFERLSSLASEVLWVEPEARDSRTRRIGPGPLSQTLGLAQRAGWVSDDWVESFRLLRAFRNDLAHGKTKVDAVSATSYLNAVLDLIWGLEAAQVTRNQLSKRHDDDGGPETPEMPALN